LSVSCVPSPPPPHSTLQRYAHEDLPVLGLGFSSVEQFVATTSTTRFVTKHSCKFEPSE